MSPVPSARVPSALVPSALVTDEAVRPDGYWAMTWGRSRSAARAVTGVAVALLVVVVAGACGSSKFRYVKSSSTHTYLKVPRSWASYQGTELAAAEAVASEAGGQKTPSLIDLYLQGRLQWRVAFDGDAHPSLDHVVSLPEAPVVDVVVRSLETEERDQISMASLRNIFFPYDQLKAEAEQEKQNKPLEATTQTTSTFRPIDEQELALPGGLRGSRLQYEVRLNDRFYTFDQTALLDAKTSRVYVLFIRAAERPFLENNKLLEEIARSFTIKQAS
jgi:hypothetical protein